MKNPRYMRIDQYNNEKVTQNSLMDSLHHIHGFSILYFFLGQIKLSTIISKSFLEGIENNLI